MKLSQKRNCNECKGGHYEIQPFWQVYELGYKVKTDSNNFIGIPQEPCYKPLTNNQWLEARRLVFPRT